MTEVRSEENFYSIKPTANVGQAPFPPITVGTVADPTLAQDQSFFFDQTGRFGVIDT
jgi:hypothetical protein